MNIPLQQRSLLIVAVLIVGAVHYLAFLQLLEVMWTQGEMVTPTIPAPILRVGSGILFALSLPFTPCVQLGDAWLPVPDTFYEGSFIANSAFWGVALVYLGYRMLRRLTGSEPHTAS